MPCELRGRGSGIEGNEMDQRCESTYDDPTVIKAEGFGEGAYEIHGDRVPRDGRGIHWMEQAGWLLCRGLRDLTGGASLHESRYHPSDLGPPVPFSNVFESSERSAVAEY